MAAHPTDPIAFSDAARRLDLPEPMLCEWLTTFQCVRRFDGQGRRILWAEDLELLTLVKSLKLLDRSCDSIVRLLTPVAPPVDLLADREELKAALLTLSPAASTRRRWFTWLPG